MKETLLNPLRSFSGKGPSTVFLFLFLLTLLAYSNTFHASWHLDDYDNIVRNTKLRIPDLRPGTLYGTLFSTEGFEKEFPRPVSRLTFALNWYFGKYKVFGYHLVNLVVHVLTAFVLFLTIHRILRLPRFRPAYHAHETSISLLTALLWALHPLQTQAVTYIVQRMTAMAALFYVLTLYLYLCARQDNSRGRRILLYVGCLLSALLAVGSKENTVTLPFALFLVEVAFLRYQRHPGGKRVLAWLAAGSGFLAAVVGLVFYMEGTLFSFLQGYEYRPFTLSQRLMTEARIVLFYLTQIIYPAPSRLSVVHDLQISTSLFEPWTTLPCIVVILLLIAVGISQVKRRPLLSFGLLFFFMNHIIESSFLPLELVFEHRNYLPTLFLFLPLSAAMGRFMDKPHRREGPSLRFIPSMIMICCLALATATYLRNRAWQTEKSLWEDAVTKAPGSSRPYHNLAWAYYHRSGSYEEALKYYELALQGKNMDFIYGHASTLTNMAFIHYHSGNYEKAVTLSRRAIKIRPERKAGYVPLIMGLTKLERREEAKKYADIYVSLLRDEGVFPSGP